MKIGVSDIGHSVRFRTMIPYTIGVILSEAKNLNAYTL